MHPHVGRKRAVATHRRLHRKHHVIPGGRRQGVETLLPHAGSQRFRHGHVVSLRVQLASNARPHRSAHGIGIGNQTELPRRLSSRVYMPPNSTAHNEYLQSLLETGLLGFPILAAFIFVLAQQARAAERRFRHADDLPTVLMLRAARVALLAVLVYALQVDVLHFPLKGWWLAMAVIAALYERRPRPQEVRHVAA